MTRRWALAGALFLTATFGFLVVALGSQAGVFAWGRGADATGDAAAGAVASPTPKPRIITEYVIVDPTPSADAAAQPGDAGADSTDAFASDDEHEADEHEGEHHDDEHHDGDHEEHEDHDD